MAEELTYSTRSVASKKRKMTEKDELSFLTHDVERVYITDSEPLTELESHMWSTSEKFLGQDSREEFYFNESELIREVDISKINQYVRLSIEENRVYRLKGSEYSIIADFDLSQGRVMLNSRNIVINSDTHVCTCCDSNICLHCEAFYECFQNDCCLFCEPNILDEVAYYTPDPHNIYLIEDKQIHNFYVRSGSWNCVSCISKCKKQCKLPPILDKIGYCTSNNNLNKEIEYKSISTLRIPLILDQKLVSTYDDQLCQGINLPVNIFPEKKFCEYGYKFNEEGKLKLENTGIVIYTENDIIELDKHKVFSSRCYGSCNCLAVFEGQSNLLLNINNRYFVHYSLLYDYSELMTKSRNTLYGYLSAKNNKLRRMGRKNTFKYHIVQHAWNSYLRMVNINYCSLFTCPQCKHEPNVIILDGIAMGTMKALPAVVPNVNTSQICPLIPFSDRVFIPESSVRRKLIDYCMQGLSGDSFDEMINSINNQVFADYVVFSSYKSQNYVTVNQKFGNFKKIIELLSRTEPITGLFQFSLLDKSERKTIALLSNGESIKEEDLVSIFQKMHTLEWLFKSINPETSTGLFTLHPVISPLLRCILNKIECLFKNPSRELIEFSDTTTGYHNYFPTFATNYKLPLYENENEETTEKCSKVFPKHHKFSPGLIALSCKHGICYGFQILRQHESTVLIYNLLLTIFKVQPKVIIYDNACNLHKTCMKRDPRVFRNTTFLVDRFHSTNHKCNPSYSMRNIHTEEIKLINSQVCEQLFSLLRRIATQIAYMRVENIFFTTRYFLACVNQDNIDKLKPT